MEPVTLTLVAVFVLAAFLLRRPWQFAPALAFAASRSEVDVPGDDDEEQPETDRAPAPRRHPLAWTVAGVAVLRVALLVALHA
ncbi:MAG: hypothetical protein E6J78_08940 [Deltaproteobacteria bacterium]|nr:MAG: hypothetical protein E6J78_08940 [Deltaproteobacteria bacterium]